MTGVAFALGTIGAAQAADLTIAEPVDYVRVCDAFGVGYWYIPGTDTCLRIGGYVQVDINVHDDLPTYGSFGTGSITVPPFFPPDVVANPDDVNSNFDYKVEAKVIVTAKSMTEYGPLTGHIELKGSRSNAQAGPYLGLDVDPPPALAFTLSNSYASTDGAVGIDKAWLELGPLLAGYVNSTYDYGGGFNFGGGSYHSDVTTKQVRLTWAMSGFGIMLAAEDYRDRWGAQATGDIPDLIAALTFANPSFDAKLSFGYAGLIGPPGGIACGVAFIPPCDSGGNGWGVQGGVTFNLDAIAPGDQLRLVGAYAENAWKFANSADGTDGGTAAGPTPGGGTYWSALASFQHFWTPNLSSAITGSYFSNPGATGWQAAANIVWSPVTNFSVGIEGQYNSNPSGDNWTGKLRLKREFGS